MAGASLRRPGAVIEPVARARKEVCLTYEILNTMTGLGMPDSVDVE